MYIRLACKMTPQYKVGKWYNVEKGNWSWLHHVTICKWWKITVHLNRSAYLVYKILFILHGNTKCFHSDCNKCFFLENVSIFFWFGENSNSEFFVVSRVIGFYDLFEVVIGVVLRHFVFYSYFGILSKKLILQLFL